MKLFISVESELYPFSGNNQQNEQFQNSDTQIQQNYVFFVLKIVQNKENMEKLLNQFMDGKEIKKSKMVVTSLDVSDFFFPE